MQNEVTLQPGVLDPYNPNAEGFYELHLVAIGPTKLVFEVNGDHKNPLTVNRTTDCIYPRLGGKLRFNCDGSKC